MFDIISMKEQVVSLYTDDLQFGFKKMSSTTICTSLMIDTIEYYNENYTDCFLLLLDASKAFDRVEYCKLFKLLRDRNVCPVLLRLLMNIYLNQSMQVKWNTILSDKFHITNGVKQGGVLSPVLYSVYVNNLIDILKSRKVGCMYGNEFMGAFGYADDLSLLCPTITGLQKMLDICEQYTKECSIEFNATKSYVMHCTKDKCTHALPSLRMSDGSAIPYTDECIHLGVTIHSNISHRNVDKAVIDLNVKTNAMLSDFAFTVPCISVMSP